MKFKLSVLIVLISALFYFLYFPLTQTNNPLTKVKANKDHSKTTIRKVTPKSSKDVSRIQRQSVTSKNSVSLKEKLLNEFSQEGDDNNDIFNSENQTELYLQIKDAIVDSGMLENDAEEKIFQIINARKELNEKVVVVLKYRDAYCDKNSDYINRHLEENDDPKMVEIRKKMKSISEKVNKVELEVKEAMNEVYGEKKEIIKSTFKKFNQELTRNNKHLGHGVGFGM